MKKLSYWVTDSGITSDKGKRCPKCGTIFEKGLKECPKCAKDIQNKNLLRPTEIEEIECPKCKTMNEKGAVVCSSCGINFVEFDQNKPLDLDVLHKAKKKKK